MALNPQKTHSNNIDDHYENIKEENAIKSYYDDNAVENKCKNCYEIEKKLLKSEQKNMKLTFENKRLKDALNNAANLQQNLLHSCKTLSFFRIFHLIFF